MEFLHNIDIDFHQIEKNLEQRRRVKLSLLTMIFLLSLAAIIYSVIHDLRTNKGKFFHILHKTNYFELNFPWHEPKSFLPRRRDRSSPAKDCLFRDGSWLSRPAVSPLYEVQQRRRSVWRRGSRFLGRGGGEHQTYVSRGIRLGSMEISMSEKSLNCVQNSNIFQWFFVFTYIIM